MRILNGKSYKRIKYILLKLKIITKNRFTNYLPSCAWRPPSAPGKTWSLGPCASSLHRLV